VPRTKKKAVFTNGDINRVIDGFLHPLAQGERKVPVLLLDAALHALVEQDPPKSLVKFVRYSLPKLIEEAEKREKGEKPTGSRRKRKS
jgi:hypothetical protein